MGKNARCFGQDLVRGEHTVGGGKVNKGKGNLTWVQGDRAAEDLDETSRKILAAGRKMPAGISGRRPGGGYTIDADKYEGGDTEAQSGTSIFDPVLCELMYRWFCPPGGLVLDPFAGGSVRGIVASKLGRQYVGIELREEQVEANREQAERICGGEPEGEQTTVRVSGKWLRHRFACTPKYIQATCHGRCCEGTKGILVSLLPDEQAEHEAAGLVVSEGKLLASETGKCPHKQPSGFCGVHGTDGKPFGCTASPFTLNGRGTLIIRNRYTKLKCHGQGEPAYQTFRASLDLLFGTEEAGRLVAAAEAGADTIAATMPTVNVERLRYLDGIKHGCPTGEPLPVWHCDDSRNLVSVCGGVEADLVFTCPPYADLEVYSEDPRDISTMDYPAFLEAYREIIRLACNRLKADRFACIVVGDVRDKAGNYRNFIGDTKQAFFDAGLSLYNDAVLVTAVGSLPIRVGKQFTAGRKLGKTHQNVLVFIKGNAKTATEAVGDVEVADVTDADD
jgi:DNA modification methylase